MKKTILFLCITVVVLTAFGCVSVGEDDYVAPDTLAYEKIPSEEKKVSTVVTDGYTVDVYSTYAAITAYEGNDTELVMPSSVAGMPVKLIAERAFWQNTDIVKVTLPEYLIEIGRYAFDECTELKEIVFGDKLQTVSDFAFRNSGLQVLNLPESLVNIGKYSFYGIKIETLKIPDGVSRPGKFAFYGCTSLKSVTFGKRITEIGDRMFYNCTALTEVVIPKTVRIIGEYAFNSCTSLTKIVVPKQTNEILAGAFLGCDVLTVYAPEGSAAIEYAEQNGIRSETVEYDSFVSANGDING